MRSRSALSLRVGLAVALASVASTREAAAQNRPPPPPPRATAPTPTIGAPEHRQSFPVGLAVGLGLGLGLAVLGGILNSRASSDDTDGSEPPREPAVPPPPGPGPTEPTPHRVRVVTRIIGPQTIHGKVRGPGGKISEQAPRPGFVVPSASERRYAPDEVLVTTKGAVSPAALRRLEAALGLTPVTVAHIDLLDADVRLFRLRPGSSVAATIRALRGQKLVAEAEPNFAFELQDDPHPAESKPDKAAPPEAKAPDRATPVQYAVAALHLDEAHRVSGGENIRVAIIDSGIDETNPDLKDAVVERFDAIGGTFAAQAHGTAMAGAIVAHQTLVGVAPKARLIAIRAFAGAASRGTGSGFNVLRGLDFAAAHAARIVNMSFAGPRDLLVGQALAAARKRGIVAIAAAGNAGPSAKPLYPGAEDGVIAVTATDAAGKPFAQANRGAYVAVAAPGVDIIAPGLGSAVQISTGTSIACAEASGVAALVLSRRPDATPDAVRKILTSTAQPMRDDASASGAGLIDAAAAVRAAK